MASVLDKEMYGYFTQLNEAEKRSVVQMLKTFLKSRQATSDHISIGQYNKELDAAMRRMDEDKFTTVEDLEKEMEGW
ncbi:hypothetical protein [Niabella sp.]|uniref:hypothetical protein n=1 Tax=Niabella sp. TaxID=1962976 RepID=UPI00262B4A9E|nr:hypothetical protein [Niabella sp.]